MIYDHYHYPTSGKSKNKLLAFVKELGGEIISITSDKQARKKALLLNEIAEGLREVKAIREGKSKSPSMSHLLSSKEPIA